MIASLSSSDMSFLNNLDRIQNKVTRTTEQISSGYRIQQASDAPDQISELLGLQAALNHNQNVVKTLSRVHAEMQTADGAISTALQLLEQARSLGAQGSTGTATTASRADLARQVQAIQEQLVALANSKAAGRFLFSGDQDTNAPYSLNLNQPVTVPQNGVDRMLTTPVSATRKIELAEHLTAVVDQTAQDLFDHRNADDSLATDNVFAALNSLRVALASNVTANITTALTSLQTSYVYLDSTQALYGAAINRISDAGTEINTRNATLQKQISDIRDTDVVQAALELSAAQTQNQAALAAQAKIPRTTLFDFFG